VSPVKYELGFISQKTAFFIVTAVNTSNLTGLITFHVSYWVLNSLNVGLCPRYVVAESLHAQEVGLSVEIVRDAPQTQARN
jgi:hypothetical protein